MKLCVYCTCMGQLTPILPEAALRAALAPHIRLITVDRLCDAACCREALPAELAAAPTQHVVAAACSHGARGAAAVACIGAALPAARVELADIREGSLWHAAGASSQDVATQAATLAHMAFVRLEQPCAAVEPVTATAAGVLVVGAGPAGMAAASGLAALGLPVTLADRRSQAGGMAAMLGTLFPTMAQAEDVLAGLSLRGVTQRLGCTVAALRRERGGYAALLQTGGESREEHFDAVILATGAQPVLPGTAFGAGQRKGVISQMELDTLLTAVEKGRKDKEQIPAQCVFVQCVHARTEERPYCSAVCCPTAVKNALRVKALRPEAEVTILNRQMVMPGIALEEMYRAAMQAGVCFAHVDTLDAVKVEGDGQVQAVVIPAVTGERRIAAQALVCSTPLQPAASGVELAQQLGLRADNLGFVQGHEPAHPLESDAEGVFVCGSARWPTHVEQAIAQGRAAAALAVRSVRERRMPLDELPDLRAAARIRQELCSACGRCVEACPHGACRHDADGVEVVAELCRRCGVCAAVCPCRAAHLPAASPSPREILAAVQQPRQRSLS